ncbi:transcriptional repressor LexA [Dyella sp.]|uniref:transcriptional repressor LexA n=1 Tax=Dyella sp. TaxID=1869338 RepID=UPI002ED27BF9
MTLTPIQQRLLDYLRDHIATHGYPPSQLDIAAALGFRQNRSARLHLEALAASGHIAWSPGRARGIRVLADGQAQTQATLQVPLLGRVAAGQPIGSDAQVRRQVTLDEALFHLRPDYLLEVQGDSMILDGILPGDLIGVHRTSEARNGQIVVARLEGEFTVKRWEHRQGRIRLLPRNPEHAPIEVDATLADFALEGLFAGLIRPG